MVLKVIDSNVPLHPLCIAATTFLTSSTNITGTQSAVKIPTAIFFILVITASPSMSFISFPVYSNILSLCICFRYTTFSRLNSPLKEFKYFFPSSVALLKLLFFSAFVNTT